jgi:hypothetical protein
MNEEQRNEVGMVVRHPPSHERDRTHPDNGSMNTLVSTPPGSLRTLDECIASPAQLAKAYMGSRPSEVTPSMLGLRGQAGREDSVFLNRTPFPQKSPTMSLVTKPSGQRPLENGFVTPRSRGRSAVYSMARTPYSRPQSSVKVSILSRNYIIVKFPTCSQLFIVFFFYRLGLFFKHLQANGKKAYLLVLDKGFNRVLNAGAQS